MPAQRDLVPESELGQALFVELLKEFGCDAIQREGLADHRRWDKAFVVAHPRHQKYQAKDAIKSRANLRRELLWDKVKDKIFLKPGPAAKPIPQQKSRN